MFDWAAEQLFKTMVIIKCIVIVCDLKVVHKNSDYIWKEHTKLSLAHLCLSNFVYLYEYIVIRSKHFTIDNSECSWALPEISMVGFHFLCNRRRHPPSVGRHSAFQSFSMARRDHTHTGVSINIWIISYIYVDLEWTLLLLKVIRHSHTRSHYWKSSQTPIIRSAPEGKPISIFRPFHEEKTRDCALREVFSIISSKLDFSSILFIEAFL